jgi:hypothetical protein
MLRKERLKFFAVGLLALTLASANSVCLNCYTPDVTLHVPPQGSAMGVTCDAHSDCEANECPDSHCGDFLSMEGFAPRKSDTAPDAGLSLGDTAPAFVAVLPSINHSLAKDSRPRRSLLSPFQLGLIPRLI